MPSPVASPLLRHYPEQSGRVAQLLRGGSWFNNPDNCRAAIRNSNHPGNTNNTVGFRPGCFAPPAPFIVRAVGRDSSGSARRVQTRSGDRSPGDRPRPARRSAQQQPAAPRPHDPGAGGLSVLNLVTVQPLRQHLGPRVRCTPPRVRPSHWQPGTNKKRPAKPVSPKASEGKAFELKTQTPIETPPVGFEPTTGCLEGSCSIRLS